MIAVVACTWWLALLALVRISIGSMHARDDAVITVTDNDIAEFILFSQYSAAAYCDATTPLGAFSCESDECDEIIAANATSTFKYTDPDSTTALYVAVDPTNELVVVAFQGSDSLRDYLLDVTFALVPCDFADGCYAHQGFLISWAAIQNVTITAVEEALAANPTYSLVATGHSLGAALATLAGATLRDLGYAVDIYTYGLPRVGNDVFADYVTAQPGADYRVTHLDDPVPKLPPIWLGYRHTSPEYWLSTGNSSTAVYNTTEIEVCVGNANVSCNAGTGGFDIDAHNTYFGPIQVCSADPLGFKKRDTGNDPELDAHIPEMEAWAQQDVDYVESLQ